MATLEQRGVTHHDVIIVGGGVVGLSVALHCLQKAPDLRVAVVDPKPAKWLERYPEDDPRVIAVNNATQQYFQDLNLWDRLVNEPIGAFHRMAVGDVEDPSADIVWEASGLGLDFLGYIISLGYLQNLLSQALEHTRVVRYSVAPQALHLENTHVLLDLPERRLQGSVLLAADGRDSWVAQSLDWPSHTHDYGHEAWTGVVRLATPHHRQARQVFTREGTLALLPLKDPRQAVFVWSLPPERAAHCSSFSEEEWGRVLTKASHQRWGTIERVCSPVATFPLQQRNASTYVQPRVALLGDAAHTLHPLAGAGANLGWADARALSEALIDAHQRQRDVGGWDVLKRYQRHRQTHNRMYLSAMRAFVASLPERSRVLAQGRRWAMKTANRCGFLKYGLAHWAEHY